MNRLSLNVYLNRLTCRMAAVERHPVLHHTADYFLWDHWDHCCIFENGVLLMGAGAGWGEGSGGGGVSSVANFITAYEESQ